MAVYKLDPRNKFSLAKLFLDSQVANVGFEH